MTDVSSYISEIRDLSASEIALNDKMLFLKRILERLCKEVTRDEAVQFPNLFSRLVFIAQKYNLPKQLEWQLQHFRVKSGELRKKSISQIDKTMYFRSERAVLNLCNIIAGSATPTEPDTVEEIPIEKSVSHLRVQILSVHQKEKLLVCAAESAPGKEITVKYGVTPDNAAFNTSVELFWKGAQLNLIDFTIDKKGRLIPKYIVLEPDYLIDASAIAECFQDYAVSPLHYFRNKFEEKENRSYLLLGNLANFFLDELVFAENPHEVSFDDVFFKSFKQSPFEYTSCEDLRSEEDFRAFMAKAKNQFNNIRRVVTEDFPKRGIDVHRCTLEPSFFSEKFGFQGRLDLLHTSDTMHIVELKSGRLPYPPQDFGKIALNHEVQTAVYRLMIQSVFSKDARKIDAAILYSSGNFAGENLRFAAVYQELGKQIVNLRNLIVANEYALANGNNSTVHELFVNLFQSIDTTDRLPNFFIEKIQKFNDILAQCTEFELIYFYRYIRFISKEIYLQKIGDIEYETPTGVASLWNSDFSERAEALDVIYNLSIAQIDDSGNDMVLVFARNENDNDIVNFREGEICIVYPRENNTDTVLNRQILKGSIVRITKDSVEVRFRYKQKNKAYFNESRLWAIEHDTLDSSYNSMYKSLFSFLGASKQKRNLLLGLEEPKSSYEEIVSLGYPEGIIDKAFSAEDYFLIVGPPGTGKTSIFARRLIEKYYTQPNTNILVLAYTNRAVDELCDAINAAFHCSGGACDAYIRVGTELSCAEPYRHRLFQRISENAVNREALRHEIEKTRIFVSTLASINGRLELFALKHFHVAVIDEASQILEPQIIGLLPRFDKFVMIGDHNQLSTIVLQKPLSSKIHDEALNEIGLLDCRDSFFERLLRQCIQNDWQQAFSQLNQQGRMHVDIAAFPAKYFYNGNLFPALDWQSESRNTSSPSSDPIHQCVATKRVAFFSTEKLHRFTPSNKINETEADIIVRIAQAIKNVYEANEKPFNSHMLGIIAPYRNQIALIKHKLEQAGFPDAVSIMIDTVERFQGSQREIILMSFCVNKPYQMDFLCNLSQDGKVDRKLNVALTRARQQLFLVGNRQILKKHPIYATLMEFLNNDTIVMEESKS